jgi:formate dehydrogenase
MPVPPPSARTTSHRRDRPPAYYPKGRQLDPAALDEIRGLLDREPRRRDLLIEHLHRIQDWYGCISARHLAALAAEMRLAQAEVYEVASFYAHFDVVLEDETPPPPLTVRVCDGIACEIAGGHGLQKALAETLGPGVRVISAPCVGACDKAPVAVVGKRQIHEADLDAVASAAHGGLTSPDVPPFTGFEAYLADGGYRTLRTLIAGEQTRDQVADTIDASGLRGLGGAGFPKARKWRFLLQAPKPRLLAVNADEGEPGTFKDRYLLETDPHRVLEGALIAAWAVEAEAIYVYVRDEYPAARALLADEIAEVKAAGLADGVEIHLRRGAGAYICGEESAMLESIEGKRGLPRNRPPFPAQKGLFGRPTLINNVETLYWLRDILERGAEWYQDAGRPRYYSVSGRVKVPGVKLAPSTVTARQLIDDHSGGMLDGHIFKGYLPGGASGGILPADKADLPLDFGALDAFGCFVGSGAVVVLSDRDDLRAVVRNLLAFFEDESCGQCTPCRVGCEKMLALLDRPAWDLALMNELAQAMRDASICGLGQAAPNPVLSALRFFAEDVG